VYNLGFFATRVHGVSIVLTWHFIIGNHDNQLTQGVDCFLGVKYFLKIKIKIIILKCYYIFLIC
jgi:hypothetical protein